jgi:hypothetical protein
MKSAKTLHLCRRSTLICSAAISSTCITPAIRAADQSWTNGHNTNRWDDSQNWQNNLQPDFGDRAIIATGSGAFLRLTNGATGVSEGVGTILITTDRNQDISKPGYYALESSNSSSTVSTITFSASGAGTGLVLNMGTFDMSGGATWQSGSFYVGAGAQNDGTVVTSISESLAAQVAQKQRLNYYSTIRGTGSIPDFRPKQRRVSFLIGPTAISTMTA